MRRSAFLLPLFGLAFAPVVMAQPAPAPKTSSDPAIETVIVTAPRYHFGVTPNAIAHDFIGSYAAPTLLLGTIPRWQAAICLEIRGVWPQFADFVNQRLRQIAAQVGAPVGKKDCRPNLSVTFTPEPQKLLDNIRTKNALALGYRGATTVTHPIEAWYETGTRDIDGRTEVDRDQSGSSDIEANCGGSVGAPSCWRIMTSNTGGWRGRTDLSGDFLTVNIIADSSKIGSYQVASVADYIAMLALSRTEDYDDCQIMPSITNLLSPNCDDKLKPNAITATDIAYLHGVYKMDAGANLQIQQDQIAGEMAAALGKGK